VLKDASLEGRFAARAAFGLEGRFASRTLRLKDKDIVNVRVDVLTRFAGA
jgi:hypothetical protein